MVSFVDELAVVPPFLFGLCFCSSLSWAVFRVRRVRGFGLVSTPREGVVLLLFVLLFFVLFLAFSAVAFALLSGWRSCSWLSRWLPWPPGLRCYVGPPRIRRSWGLSSRSLSMAFSSTSLWFGILAVFCGILRVAGCPPGGGICGM